MNKDELDRIEEKYDPKSVKFFRSSKNSLDGLVKKVIESKPKQEEEYFDIKHSSEIM